MNNNITYIYIVTDFGSYGNDEIYPPDMTAFIDREKAYAYYNKIKELIIDQEYPYESVEYDDMESLYQITYEDERAKRPRGVSIKKVQLDKE